MFLRRYKISPLIKRPPTSFQEDTTPSSPHNYVPSLIAIFKAALPLASVDIMSKNYKGKINENGPFGNWGEK